MDDRGFPLQREGGRNLVALSRRRLARGSARSAHPVLASRLIRPDIIPLTRLVGCPVLTEAGERDGRIADVAAQLPGGDAYPLVTGIVVRAGRRRAFLDAMAIGHAGPRAVRLRAARIEWGRSECRPGEVLLARDVLDRQLVHTGEAQVIRAADLYLAAAGAEMRLVGVVADLRTLLLRLGPRRLRGRPIVDGIIDWAVIERFSPGPGEVPAAGVQRTPHAGLRRLCPGEVAHVLEALGRYEREELLASLGFGMAADTVEQMQADDLTAPLSEADPARAADPGDRAGGVMTIALACAYPAESVERARRRLSGQGGYRAGIGSVVVLDESGGVAGDVPVFDLLLSDGGRRVADLIDPANPPVTVHRDAPLSTVTAKLVESRQSSLLVLDDEGHPLGRIAPGDVLDAHVPGYGDCPASWSRVSSQLRRSERPYGGHPYLS